MDDNSGLNQTTSEYECRLIGMIPFSFEREPYPPYMANFGYTHMAAALLAVDHFNARNPVVVPQLAELECSVNLPDPIFTNTNALSEDTSRFLVNRLLDSSKGDYCGMVGPFHNGPTLAAANFALGMEIPLITHGADDTSISSDQDNPLTGRTATHLHALSEVLLSLMRTHGRTDYLSTIAPIDEGGHQYRTVMDNKAKQAGFTGHITFSTKPHFEDSFIPNNGVGYALQKTKEAGYRNIFFVLQHVSVLSVVAKYAEQFGMLNGKYFWMTSGNLDFEEVANMASVDANVSKLVRGLSAVGWLDGFDSDPDNDGLLQAWTNQNETFVDRVNALHPVQNNETTGYFQAEPDYFQTRMPQHGAGFMYDAVMSIALGKCNEIASSSLQGPPPVGGVDAGPEGGADAIFTDGQPGGSDGSTRRRRVKGEKLPQRRLQKAKKAKKLNPHLEGIVNSVFQGATGTISFHNGTGQKFPGNREKATLSYGAYNFRSIDASDESSG